MFAATLALLITALFYLLIPVFAVIILVFFLKNKLIETVAKKWKGVRSMLIFGAEYLLVVRKTVIYFELRIGGKLNINELKNKFQQLLLKTDSSREPIYRTLQERITWVWGYSFWTRNENFSLENHIDSYPSNPGETVTSDELEGIRKELLERRFDVAKQSPWQLTSINVNDNGRISTILFMRIHHLLCDGHALFHLLNKLIADEDAALLKSTRMGVQVNPLSVVWDNLKAPYNLFKDALKVGSDPCPWPTKSAGSRITAISNYIPLADIKAAGKEAGVGVTTVLMAGIGRGLQIAPKSLFTFDNTNALPAMLMIRRPSRKADKLKSPGGPLSLVKLPLQIQDGKKCLQETNTVITKALKSGLFTTPFLRMVEGAANILRPRVHEKAGAVVPISNFPGPLSQVTSQGYPIEEMDFGLQIDANLDHLLFSVFSYNGFLRIRINADACVVSSKEEGEGIIAEIENQIRLFKESGNDSIV